MFFDQFPKSTLVFLVLTCSSTWSLRSIQTCTEFRVFWEGAFVPMSPFRGVPFTCECLGTSMLVVCHSIIAAHHHLPSPQISPCTFSTALFPACCAAGDHCQSSDFTLWFLSPRNLKSSEVPAPVYIQAQVFIFTNS